jgi:hypothetical protein
MMGGVPPRGRGGDVAASGELRASHEDRDRVAELLRVAAGDGRLSLDELDNRLDTPVTLRIDVHRRPAGPRLGMPASPVRPLCAAL